jgi:rhamnulokinase
MTTNYLGFDLGAESGRAILGRLSRGTLELEQLHRFANMPVQVHNTLYWDILSLWREIQQGIRIATNEHNLKLDGIGIDAWGVDFGLLGADGQLLENPRHYRDRGNAGMMDRVFERVPREEVFAQTGLQFMQINTLYQLYGLKLAVSPALRSARRLLNIPDLFNYWLTGEAKSEVTIASTTQFFDPVRMQWATDLFQRLELPEHILCELISPGTLLGKTLDAPHAPVYATAGHDTAAAVAAVPAGEQDDWCFVSSGTWSLMGVEMDAPSMGEECLRLNYSNEVGAGGKIRLLKNIAGLWLLQECRRAWTAEGEEHTYEDLTQMAAGARPFVAILHPDALGESGAMPKRIARHCRETAQESPATRGEYVRVVLEGLALRYRDVLESLEALTGRKIETIHIVGGGARNMLLNRFVADCTQRKVMAGPSEATAAGNILMQALGAGELQNLDGVRAVVRKSFAPTLIEPGPGRDWQRAYERYRSFAVAQADPRELKKAAGELPTPEPAN